jgi:hypothetical protein
MIRLPSGDHFGSSSPWRPSVIWMRPEASTLTTQIALGALETAAAAFEAGSCRAKKLNGNNHTMNRTARPSSL